MKRVMKQVMNYARVGIVLIVAVAFVVAAFPLAALATGEGNGETSEILFAPKWDKSELAKAISKSKQVLGNPNIHAEDREWLAQILDFAEEVYGSDKVTQPLIDDLSQTLMQIANEVERSAVQATKANKAAKSSGATSASNKKESSAGNRVATSSPKATSSKGAASAASSNNGSNNAGINRTYVSGGYTASEAKSFDGLEESPAQQEAKAAATATKEASDPKKNTVATGVGRDISLDSGTDTKGGTLVPSANKNTIDSFQWAIPAFFSVAIGLVLFAILVATRKKRTA